MKKLNAIIEKIFAVGSDEIKDETPLADIPNWDSMNHLALIAEVEKQFGVTFLLDEVVGVKNIGDIRAIIRNRGIEPK